MIRWSCRAGDYILWLRYGGLFAPQERQFRVSDLWQLKNRDFVTVTNRLEDVPPWFELHPLEAQGELRTG